MLRDIVIAAIYSYICYVGSYSCIILLMHACKAITEAEVMVMFFVYEASSRDSIN